MGGFPYGRRIARAEKDMAITARDEPRPIWPADVLGRVFELLTASHARAVALLVAVALLAFLPGFFQVPPVDRDEARYAQATRQMMETGNYLDIRYQEQVRYLQPAGIYWLQAAAAQ